MHIGGAFLLELSISFTPKWLLLDLHVYSPWYHIFLFWLWTTTVQTFLFKSEKRQRKKLFNMEYNNILSDHGNTIGLSLWPSRLKNTLPNGGTPSWLLLIRSWIHKFVKRLVLFHYEYSSNIRKCSNICISTFCTLLSPFQRGKYHENSRSIRMFSDLAYKYCYTCTHAKYIWCMNLSTSIGIVFKCTKVQKHVRMQMKSKTKRFFHCAFGSVWCIQCVFVVI